MKVQAEDFESLVTALSPKSVFYDLDDDIPI